MELRQYDPLVIERMVRNYWFNNNIISKCFSKNSGRARFNFLEGPPTTNGFMHVGHARGRTLKDIIIKFKLMQGYDVWRRAGWDTQGLPVELEVEKNLGLKTKKDIERVGYDKFVEECNKLVDFYLDHWRRASEILGLWLDYDSAYETRRNEYIEFVWWALKQAYDKGMLVEDFKVIAFCPRCETPLSDQEVALGYTTIEDPSIYVKVPLADEENTYVVIWTTTPWTLPANEALCLNPIEYYVKVKVDDEVWILAEKLLGKVINEIKLESYNIVGRFLGSELEGKKYLHPLLDEVPMHKDHYEAHMVVCDESVSVEEGTGCVHIAPAHGPEDFEIGKRYSLPVFCPVDVNGIYTEDAGKYKGMYIKEANKLIMNDLKRKGLLINEGSVIHEYPHCWRCNTPLFYKADRQWFLSIGPIKARILDENSKVEWVPQWAGRARFHNWIENARDWCISRLRVWGSPLNIWTCGTCKRRICVGSIDELKKLSVEPIEVVRLHRPWIDMVKIRCPWCGGEMHREPHVLDCWLDSGVAHAASVDFLKDRTIFERVFPYDFITEAVDQTRGWFFSLIFTSVMLFDVAPYRRVLCQGHVLDKLGQKMSKSKGNVVWALDVMEKEGADLLRLYLVTGAAPWETLNFDIEELKVMRRTLNVIFNVFKFASTYMELDNFKYEKHPLDRFVDVLNVEDQWILSRIQTIIDRVTSNLESLNIHEAAKAIVDFFIKDLSHGYIRFIRRRVWLEEEAVEKITVYSVLYYVLDRALRLLAPFTPHFAEWLYQNFIKKFGERDEDTIFMLEWPKKDSRFVKHELEEGAEVLTNVLTLIANARQKAKLKSRWPVSQVTIVLLRDDFIEKVKPFSKVLTEQANARAIVITNNIPSEFSLKVKVQEDEVKRRLGEKTSHILEALKRRDPKEVLRELCLYGKIRVKMDDEEVEIKDDEVEVIEEKKVGKALSLSFGRFAIVAIDTTRDVELEAEAITREIVRRVQYMRKELDLKIDDYIDLVIETKDHSLNILTSKNLSYLKNEVRARELKIVDKATIEGGDWYMKEWDIDGLKLSIYLRRS